MGPWFAKGCMSPIVFSGFGLVCLCRSWMNPFCWSNNWPFRFRGWRNHTGCSFLGLTSAEWTQWAWGSSVSLGVADNRSAPGLCTGPPVRLDCNFPHRPWAFLGLYEPLWTFILDEHMRSFLFHIYTGVALSGHRICISPALENINQMFCRPSLNKLKMIWGSTLSYSTWKQFVESPIGVKNKYSYSWNYLTLLRRRMSMRKLAFSSATIQAFGEAPRKHLFSLSL